MFRGAVFGGFAPTILTWLTQRLGASAAAPAWCVMLAAVVALVFIPFVSAHEHPAVLAPGAGSPAT